MNFSTAIGYYEGVPPKGAMVKVTEWDLSCDGGRTWHRTYRVRLIHEKDFFHGVVTIAEASWESAGVIHSGHKSAHCSKYNGKRWVSFAQK